MRATRLGQVARYWVVAGYRGLVMDGYRGSWPAIGPWPAIGAWPATGANIYDGILETSLLTRSSLGGAVLLAMLAGRATFYTSGTSSVPLACSTHSCRMSSR